MANDINPSNYPGNSHKERIERKQEMNEQIKDDQKTKEEKKVEKVISGAAVTRKKGLGRKIAETFAGDDAQSVGQYILFDVVIPAAKAMISDAASQGVERLLFGDSSRRTSTTSRGSSGYTSYSKMYSPNREDRPSGPPGSRAMTSKARATHDFSEVVLETRAEAEEVMGCMDDLIEKYGIASVAEFYELVGITGSFTDDKFGWDDLRGSDIRRVRQGYLLILPKPKPLT